MILRELLVNTPGKGLLVMRPVEEKTSRDHNEDVWRHQSYMLLESGEIHQVFVIIAQEDDAACACRSQRNGVTRRHSRP